MKQTVLMLLTLCGNAFAQDPEPVWELGRNPIDPATTQGDVQFTDGVVKLDCSNAFTIPAAVLGDQKDYTVELEFRRAPSFQTLPKNEGALLLVSNRDPESRAGLSLIYFPPAWDKTGGVGNAVGIEVNTYWNGETGGLDGNGFNTYSLVVKDKQASLYRNGMLLAMTGAIEPSPRPLRIGGAGWRGTPNAGFAKATPEPYELRALRVYNVALAPSGYDTGANVMRNMVGEGYTMQCADVTDTALPQILVVGDSISMGYRRHITAHFKGKAYVDYWVGGSWFDSTVKEDDFPALRAWDGVLSNGPYHVVSWNAMTLHMWTPLHANRCHVDRYPAQMTRVVEHVLRTAPDTKFLWVRCTPYTTPVEGGTSVIDEEKSERLVTFNALTDEIMKRYGIPTIDLYGLCERNLDKASKDGVHWSSDASKLMAEEIIAEIEKALDGI